MHYFAINELVTVTDFKCLGVNSGLPIPTPLVQGNPRERKEVVAGIDFDLPEFNYGHRHQYRYRSRL